MKSPYKTKNLKKALTKIVDEVNKEQKKTIKKCTCPICHVKYCSKCVKNHTKQELRGEITEEIE